MLCMSKTLKILKQAITFELSNHTIKSYVCRSMSKMSKIDQIHIRARNTMYVEDVKDIKTSHNRCTITKYVEDVKDNQIHNGCNAMSC